MIGRPAFAAARRLLALLAGMALWASHAQATCQRPLNVPVTAMGHAVTVKGDAVKGVYPTLLADVAARTGCRFRFENVPRARVQRLFDAGEADLLLPANRTPERDAKADFVPLVRLRPALISLSYRQEVPVSLPRLLHQSRQRVAVVRGFDFGPEYRQALAELQRQNRLVQERDPASLARALQAGMAELALLSPLTLAGSLEQDVRLYPLLAAMHFETLEALPWMESGIYLSRQRLSEADRSLLRATLTDLGQRRQAWQLFHQLHAPGSALAALRPLHEL